MFMRGVLGISIELSRRFMQTSLNLIEPLMGLVSYGSNV